MNLEKTIIVSGGSRGLGLALTEGFLANGYKVGTFSRSCSSEIERLKMIYGNRLFWKSVDATNPEELATFTKDVRDRLGLAEALVNNAGIAIDGNLAFTKDSEIKQGIALNLESAILLTKYCLNMMLVLKRGAIVNISSINGVKGHKGVSVYSATKAAMDGFSRSLARDLGPKNVRVNSVAPGYFESDMTSHLSAEVKATIAKRTPLLRLGTTNDIFEAVKFLVSDSSQFITGQTLVVDGGITC